MLTEYLQKAKYYGIAYGHFRISNIFVRVSDLFAVVCNTFVFMFHSTTTLVVSFLAM